jgi:hypothetical protein
MVLGNRFPCWKNSGNFTKVISYGKFRILKVADFESGSSDMNRILIDDPRHLGDLHCSKRLTETVSKQTIRIDYKTEFESYHNRT